MVEKSKITLPGTVEKIIEPVRPHGREKVQVAVEGADPLYQEIRIENTLQSPNGEQVRLKKGAEVDVTIEASHDASSKHRITKTKTVFSRCIYIAPQLSIPAQNRLAGSVRVFKLQVNVFASPKNAGSKATLPEPVRSGRSILRCPSAGRQFLP
jgi:hypothetical protein